LGQKLIAFAPDFMRFLLLLLLFRFVDNDRAAADCGGWIRVFVGFNLIVVDDSITIVLIPDLYSEQIKIGAWRQLLINR
jgi:hypothetical protein